MGASSPGRVYRVAEFSAGPTSLRIPSDLLSQGWLEFREQISPLYLRFPRTNPGTETHLWNLFLICSEKIIRQYSFRCAHIMPNPHWHRKSCSRHTSPGLRRLDIAFAHAHHLQREVDDFTVLPTHKLLAHSVSRIPGSEQIHMTLSEMIIIMILIVIR